MKAIVLPYAVDQNCPSTPLNKLVDVPDNEAELRKMLYSLAEELFMLDEEESPEEDFRLLTDVQASLADIEFVDECVGLYLTFIAD